MKIYEKIRNSVATWNNKCGSEVLCLETIKQKVRGSRRKSSTCWQGWRKYTSLLETGGKQVLKFWTMTLTWKRPEERSGLLERKESLVYYLVCSLKYRERKKGLGKHEFSIVTWIQKVWQSQMSKRTQVIFYTVLQQHPLVTSIKNNPFVNLFYHNVNILIFNHIYCDFIPNFVLARWTNSSIIFQGNLKFCKIFAVFTIEFSWM